MAEDTVIVPLTQGKEAIIDAQFAPAVLARKWYAKKDKGGLWYAARSFKQQGMDKSERLHRFIYALAYGPIAPGMQIDHRNGNGLDNRLVNLRAATTRENQINQQMHRAGRLPGAYRIGQHTAWHAQIKIQGKVVYLGTFVTEQEAHQAYVEALKRHQSEA